MGSCRVHYYVDEIECWQNLLDTEIGWHVSYSKNPIANDQSVSIEIIGADEQAEDNGARLVAFLMDKYNLTIDKVRTHQSWSGKNCPAFILPHWDAFLAKVKSYSAQKPAPMPAPAPNEVPAEEKPQKSEKNYLMLSKGRASIRTEPDKSGERLGAVQKDYYYAFSERVINDKNEIWFKHDCAKPRYSMYKDEAILFTQVGTYKKGRTLAKLNLRKSPTTASPVLSIIPNGELIYILDSKNDINCDGFTWKKVMYRNQFLGYVADKYIKVG